MALSAEELTIRYLGWAGVELRYGANAVFIDPQLFALQAARLLGAQTVAPIHFGAHLPRPTSRPTRPSAASSTRREGSARRCACCAPATSSSSPRSREPTASAAQRCETSIHSASASAASRSGAMRSAACVSPAAGTTTSKARSDTSA